MSSFTQVTPNTENFKVFNVTVLTVVISMMNVKQPTFILSYLKGEEEVLKEEFVKLKKGQLVELLDLSLERTGKIYPIHYVGRSAQYPNLVTITIHREEEGGKKKRIRISNERRVAFPQLGKE